MVPRSGPARRARVLRRKHFRLHGRRRRVGDDTTGQSGRPGP